MSPMDLLALVKDWGAFYLSSVDWPHEKAEEAALRLYFDGALNCRTTVMHEGRLLYASYRYVPDALAKRYAVTEWEDETAEGLDIEQIDVCHLWKVTS